MEGTVKMVDVARGFGFIRVAGSPDVFFHRSNAEKWDVLAAGDRVTFDPVPGRNGRQAARNVRLADADAPQAPVKFGTRIAGDQGEEAA